VLVSGTDFPKSEGGTLTDLNVFEAKTKISAFEKNVGTGSMLIMNFLKFLAISDHRVW